MTSDKSSYLDLVHPYLMMTVHREKIHQLQEISCYVLIQAEVNCPILFLIINQRNKAECLRVKSIISLFPIESLTIDPSTAIALHMPLNSLGVNLIANSPFINVFFISAGSDK